MKKLTIMFGKDVFSNIAAVRHFTAIANNLVKMSAPIQVYAVETDDVYKMNMGLLHDGIKYSVVNMSECQSKYLHWGRFLPIILKFVLAEVKTYLKRYQFINVYTRGDIIGIAVAFLLKFAYRNRINVIIEHNDWIYERGKLLNYPRFVNSIGNCAQVGAAKRVDYNRVVTKGIADLLIAAGVSKSKIFIAGNGSSPELFKPLSRNETLKKLHLDQRYFYVGFIGSLEKWQGVDILIKSIYLLRDLEEMKLLLVGEGSERAYLEQLAKQLQVAERIVFVGKVPSDEVPFWINVSDICCYTPIKERNNKVGVSPLKIREYAMCGKPIVASKIKGLEEIEENGFGILVSSENEKEFAGAVRRLYKNHELLLKLGIKAREYALENYSWNPIVRTIYERLI